MTSEYVEGGHVLCYASSELSACDLAFDELGADAAEDCKAERAPEYDDRCKDKLVAFIENDNAWLRRKYWQLENDTHCDVCGLATMGLTAYAVCRFSGSCKECGCDVECDHRDGFACG